MSEGKVLIMGVGGCGSSFLWGLLGDCGLETQGINEWMRHSGIQKAEDPKDFKFPRVIKHLGGFINSLNHHVDKHGWEVEHVFFAVASYDLQMESYRNRKGAGFDFREIQAKYRDALGKGLLHLIERDHPFTIVRCPRSLTDSQYCYNKLKVVLGGMKYEEFAKIHTARVVPEMIPDETI